jgi:hypothetical protein
VILLSLACSTPPAGSYADALTAPTFEAAWAICATIAPPNRGDCQQVTVTRFENFEACEQVDPGVWREECLFTLAEARAHAADRAGALTACAKSKFTANCEQHVLEGMAMEYLQSSPAELDAAWTAVKPLTQGKNAELDLWRSWNRVRIQEGIPFEKCPSKPCRTAQQVEVMRATEELLRRDSCDTFDVELVWEPNSDASRWAASVVRQRCENAPLSGREDVLREGGAP